MKDTDWQLLSWVERSKNRTQVLIYLLRKGEPQKPTDIASALDAHLQHISRALRQMSDPPDHDSLVICINPDAPNFRRYRLTDRGRLIAEKLAESQ